MTENQTLQISPAVLRAGKYTSLTRIFAPPAATLRTANAESAPPATAIFEVTYNGFSDEAKRVFQAAVDVWSVILKSDVPIRVEANWKALDAGVLGSAGARNYIRDFPAAPTKETWYPMALANKLEGSDLDAGNPHIIANFSSSFSNWYFGLDGNTPADNYDLMSVVLHELGHGLGFIGSMQVDNTGIGSWGAGTQMPIVYDRFVENLQGQSILDTSLFPNSSVALADQLQSSQLYWIGPNTTMSHENSPVRIYAPMSWKQGSSFSHLNEDTFPPGNSNSLMTPQLGLGESIHSPGAIGYGILQDLGW